MNRHCCKRAATVAALALLTAAGCRAPSPQVEPAFAVPGAFASQGAAPVPERWWQALADERLNRLMDQALADNFTILAAWDRLNQAEQVARQAGASVWPSVTYQATAQRARVDTGPAQVYANDFSLGLTASYEVDLWGRVRSVRDAARLDAQARREDVATAAVTVSAGLARTWFQLAEARQREALIAQQVKTNQDVLDLVTLRYRQGLVGAPDVLRQEQLVESTRGELVRAREQIVLLGNSLAVLAGRTPQSRASETDPCDLVELAPLPRVGLPADVLRRRPDLRSAFMAVQAANERVATAVVDQYPVVTLTARLQTDADAVEDLFKDWLASLAGQAAGPLFDAGRRKAEVERRRAVLSEAIHLYSEKVLQALREVEDALAAEQHQRQTLESLQRQLTLAVEVTERTRQKYIQGQLDYLRVLEALQSQQRLERDVLGARRTLIERRIDLHRSIAGSWSMEQPNEVNR